MWAIVSKNAACRLSKATDAHGWTIRRGLGPTWAENVAAWPCLPGDLFDGVFGNVMVIGAGQAPRHI